MKYIVIIVFAFTIQLSNAQEVKPDSIRVTSETKSRKLINFSHYKDPVNDRCLSCINSVWMASVGYSFQKNSALEVGFRKTSLIRYPRNRYSNSYTMRYMWYSYLYLGTEIIQSRQNKFIPKVGFGYHVLILNAQVSTLFYTNSHQKIEPAVLTELGLSMFGVIQINYGYQFPIGSLEVNPKPNHRLILRLAIPIND